MKIAKDKLKHMGACFVSTTFGSLALTILIAKASLLPGLSHRLIIIVSLAVAIALSVGLSFGKELGDYFNPNSSGYAGDLLADLIGIIFGIMASVFIYGLTF